jgi:hypothetical protein
MRAEYEFDYRQGKPNPVRFRNGRGRGRRSARTHQFCRFAPENPTFQLVVDDAVLIRATRYARPRASSGPLWRQAGLR